MSKIWKLYYALFGFGSFIVPSLVFAFFVKSLIGINVPFVLFLFFPIYLTYFGFKFGNTDYRKVFSHFLTGFFIISIFYFFGVILLEATRGFAIYNYPVLVLILSFAVYILTIWMGKKIGLSIASHDQTIDMDTVSPADAERYWGWHRWPINFH